MKPRTKTLVLLVLIPLLCLGAVEIIEACFSSPKPLTCPRSLYVIASAGGTVLNPASGEAFNAPLNLAPVVLWDTAPGCAVPGEAAASVLVSAACTASGGGNAIPIGPQSFAVPAPATPGLQPGHALDIQIAEGVLNPRTSYRCAFSTTYSVDFTGGFGSGTLSGTRVTSAGLIEESADRPGHPRVRARVLTPGESGGLPISTAHQGDRVQAYLLLENNDLTYPATFDWTSEGLQIAGLPDEAATLDQAYNDLGVYQLSNTEADIFPAASFTDDLPAGRLPGDPLSDDPRQLSGSLSLGPGEIEIFGVASESYGACSSGSCNRRNFEFLATIFDGSAGKSNDFIEFDFDWYHYVDNQVLRRSLGTTYRTDIEAGGSTIVYASSFRAKDDQGVVIDETHGSNLLAPTNPDFNTVIVGPDAGFAGPQQVFDQVTLNGPDATGATFGWIVDDPNNSLAAVVNLFDLRNLSDLPGSCLLQLPAIRQPSSSVLTIETTVFGCNGDDSQVTLATQGNTFYSGTLGALKSNPPQDVIVDPTTSITVTRTSNRDQPVMHVTPPSFAVNASLTDSLLSKSVSVTDADGNPVNYTASIEGGNGVVLFQGGSTTTSGNGFASIDFTPPTAPGETIEGTIVFQSEAFNTPVRVPFAVRSTETTAGSVRGIAFLDRNGDGVQDPGEGGVQGRFFYADLNNNAQYDAGNEPGAESNDGGAYTLSIVNPPQTPVSIGGLLPEAWEWTVPATGFQTVDLSENRDVAGVDFASRPSGSVHGQVFDDHNANGEQEPGEAGWDGITMVLRKVLSTDTLRATTMSMDLNNDGIIDPDREQGLFWFEGVKDGGYTAVMDESSIPEGYRQREIPGQPISVQNGQRVDNIVAAITTQALLAGSKRADAGGRGDEKDFRNYFGSVVIELLDPTTMEVLDSFLLENPDLFYRFHVPPGTYIVREQEPEEDVLTFPPEKTYTVTVGSGERRTDLVFANKQFVGRISGRKFEPGPSDLLGTGLNGWTIRLQGLNSGIRQETVTADLDLDGDGTPEPGAYRFDNLPFDTYFVAEVSMPGFRQRIPTYPFWTVHLDDGTGIFADGVHFVNEPVVAVPVEDAGDGEALRQAIEDANALPDDAPPPELQLSASGKRAAVIRPTRPLPPLSRPMVVNGGNTTTLDGSLAGEGADGLLIDGSRVFVTGLSITGFDGHGVVLDGDGGHALTVNTIAGNGGNGVHAASGLSFILSSNAVYGNAGEAIDVGMDGPTPNDAGEEDGAQNFPLLTRIATSADSLFVTGALASRPDTTFVLEFFHVESCAGAENIDLLGFWPVQTDSLGRADFTARFDTSFVEGGVITATATLQNGSTSEQSPCTTKVAIDRELPLTDAPGRFFLHPNFPNPFNPVTLIQYEVPATAHVRIRVFDLLGRLVATLVDRPVSAGLHRTPFDAANLPSGVYVYRMEAGAFVRTRQMILLK